MKKLLSALVCLLLAAPALAGNLDPGSLPQIGSVAPAFGLHPFASKVDADEAREKVELDDHCGMFPGDTKLVLLVFSNAVSLQGDLEAVEAMRKKHGKRGFVPIVLSTDADSQTAREAVAKTRFTFPILDDGYKIVSARYGIPSSPFTFLLDGGCRVLGLSDKSLSVDGERIAQTVDTVLSGKLGEVE